MKRSLLFIIFLGVLIQSYAQKELNTVLGDKLSPTASFSFYAIDANTGEVLAESPQKSLVPASVMKIVTSAAALEILGPQFRFRTLFGFTGKVGKETGVLNGDAVVKGGGDPAFYSRYFTDYYKGTFEEWADRMVSSGIKKINGDLIIDISYIGNSSIPGGWTWEDIGNYYGAGVSALNYFDNLYEIHFSSPQGVGKSTKVAYTFPSIEGLVLDNKVVTSEINLDLACVYGAPLSFRQEISGTIPMNRSDFVVKAATPDPAIVAAADFKKVLSRKGIILQGNIRKVAQGKEFTVLAEKLSPELQGLIVPLNQKSVNLFAEQLLPEIGRAMKKDFSLQSSIDALSEFWKDKVNCEGFFPSDGSGLARSNSISTRTLAEILAYMYKGPNSEVFFNSLPLAGVSGTLDNSFRRTPLENNLRAKTGSMKRVRSLAGIFTSKKGKKVAFALIVNNFEGTRIGQELEDFLINLYENSEQ